MAEIPSDFIPFVQRLIAERRFKNEADVVTEGLRLLQGREILRDEVAKGFEQLDAGQGIPAEYVCSHAEARISQIEREEG